MKKLNIWNYTPESIKEDLEGNDNEFSTDNEKVVDNSELTPDSTGAKNFNENDPIDTAIVENDDNSETVIIDTQDYVDKNKLVFLGGTCSDSKWREQLINGLTINYFDPVVEDWDKSDKDREDQIKASSDYNLFVITPKQKSFVSFIETGMEAVKSPSRTLLCVLTEDEGETFSEEQINGLKAIIDTLKKHNVKVFGSLEEVRNFLNNSINSSEEVSDNETNETSESDESSDETVSTEGLIKTFKKWREGKAFDKELGDKLNTKQLDNFDDLREYIKNNPWINDKDLPKLTLRFNYVVAGTFTRDGIVVNNPFNELNKEIKYFLNIGEDYVNNSIKYIADRPIIVKELESAKNGKQFNDICDKWIKKKPSYPGDKYLGKYYKHLNDFGRRPIAIRFDQRIPTSNLYYLPYHSNSKIDQKDITVNGYNDLHLMLDAVLSTQPLLMKIRKFLSTYGWEGWLFTDEVFDNAMALDSSKFRKVFYMISNHDMEDAVFYPFRDMEFYFGGFASKALYILKEYEKGMKHE